MIEKSLELVEGIHEFDVDCFGSTQSLLDAMSGSFDYVAGIITCSELQTEHSMPPVMRGQFLPIENLGGTIAATGNGAAQVDSGMLSTIAYSIDHYSLKHLVVCSHVCCQIVRFVVNKHRADDPEAASSYYALGDSVRGIIDQFYGDLTPERIRPTIMQEHVLLQIETLLSNPTLSQLIADNNVKLHGWVVDDDTSRVFAYDASDRSFSAIE